MHKLAQRDVLGAHLKSFQVRRQHAVRAALLICHVEGEARVALHVPGHCAQQRVECLATVQDVGAQQDINMFHSRGNGTNTSEATPDFLSL